MLSISSLAFCSNNEARFWQHHCEVAPADTPAADYDGLPGLRPAACTIIGSRGPGGPRCQGGILIADVVMPIRAGSAGLRCAEVVGVEMVHVVPVGDGACAVWRPWPNHGLSPATVIDCGVWKARARTAADRLLTALEGDLSAVESFVVSHFDWDHWGGLHSLNHFPAALGTLDSATLYYPYMPVRVPAALYAFMGPPTGTGSAALDLLNALQPLLRPGESLTLQPLHSSHPPVRLGGERFEVLWPPAVVDAAFSRRLEGAVKAVEDLANDLHDARYPALKQNLDAASRGAAVLHDEVNDDGGPAVDPTLDPLLQADDAHNLDVDWPDDAEHWLDLPLEELDAEARDHSGLQNENDLAEPDDPDLHAALEALPDGFAGRYRRVLRRIRAANNDLSLVLASKSARLVCFGDISGPALRHVLTLPGLKGKHFDVMLLPHHGTHALPPGMPTARWCVAQGGARHLPRWRANHPKPHLDTHKCLNTAQDGEFFPGHL